MHSVLVNKVYENDKKKGPIIENQILIIEGFWIKIILN
jgi:hypothetical protein